MVKLIVCFFLKKIELLDEFSDDGGSISLLWWAAWSKHRGSWDPTFILHLQNSQPSAHDLVLTFSLVFTLQGCCKD